MGGARGVSLYVRDDLTVQRTGVGDSANCIFRRIVNPVKSVIVGCIYVPCSQPGRPLKRQFIRALGDNLTKLQTAYPEDNLVILGDWNMEDEALSATLYKWSARIPYMSLCSNVMMRPPEEDPLPIGPTVKPHTFQRGKRVRSNLDHVVTRGVGGPRLCTVHWTFAITNHFPIEYVYPHFASSDMPTIEPRTWPMLRLGSIPLPPKGLEEDATLRRYPNNFLHFVEDPGWVKLSRLADTARLNWLPEREVSFTKHLAETLCKTIHTLGAKCGAESGGPSTKKRPFVPSFIRNKMKKRQNIYLEIMNNPRGGLHHRTRLAAEYDLRIQKDIRRWVKRYERALESKRGCARRPKISAKTRRSSGAQY